MAEVTLKLRDLPNGKIELSLESEPILAQPFSNAQLHALCAHQFLCESGAMIALQPIVMLDQYLVEPVPPSRAE